MRKMHPASLALGALQILPALSRAATGAVTAQPTDTTRATRPRQKYRRTQWVALWGLSKRRSW